MASRSRRWRLLAAVGVGFLVVLGGVTVLVVAANRRYEEITRAQQIVIYNGMLERSLVSSLGEADSVDSYVVTDALLNMEVLAGLYNSFGSPQNAIGAKIRELDYCQEDGWILRIWLVESSGQWIVRDALRFHPAGHKF